MTFPILCIAIWLDSVIWGMILVWWFKPLYERPPMRLLSLAVFAETSSIRQNVAHSLHSQLLLSLTVYRFSWRRSAIASISLEETTNAALSTRRKLLYAKGTASLFWVCVLGWSFEVLGSVILYHLVIGFFESSENVAVNSYQDIFDQLTLMSVALGESINSLSTPKRGLYLTIYAVLINVTMPFYVGSGFSLYLNRRTILEGWDIEVGFNKLIQRLGLLTLVVCIMLPTPVHSNEMPDHASDVPDHQSVITELRNSPDFNQIETVRMPILFKKILEWIKGIEPEDGKELNSNLFASILKVCLWIGMAGLLLYFVYTLTTSVDLSFVGDERKRQKRTPDHVRESHRQRDLPKDLVSAIVNAWQGGLSREAYALLYAGTLLYLSRLLDSPIGPDETETECLNRTRALPINLRTAFEQLTKEWQAVAYAGTTISESQFERALDDFKLLFISR